SEELEDILRSCQEADVTLPELRKLFAPLISQQQHQQQQQSWATTGLRAWLLPIILCCILALALTSSSSSSTSTSLTGSIKGQLRFHAMAIIRIALIKVSK